MVANVSKVVKTQKLRLRRLGQRLRGIEEQPAWLGVRPIA